jgi:hypothetical protein
VHAVLADGVVGQVDGGESMIVFIKNEYFLFSNTEMSFIMVLTPNLIEYKFNISGCFLELIFPKDYLNILAFYRSGF